MTDTILHRVGPHGPTVKRLTPPKTWRGLCVCEVVEAGNLQDEYGKVTCWMPGTVVCVKEEAMEVVPDANQQRA